MSIYDEAAELRVLLIGTKNSLASAAAEFDRRGDTATASWMRRDVQMAEQVLKATSVLA